MLELDLVIILSGGLDSDGLPHPWVLNRLDYAADQFNTNTRYFLITSRGTPHKAPPLDPNGFPIDEATAGARYLCRTKGVPAESILLDRWSMDTVGRIIECGRMEDAADGRQCLLRASFSLPAKRVHSSGRGDFSIPHGP
ncbi:hypothetical protein FOZ62_011065 [Perkinsus olseni]|uniref:DUF218 domain-containing protein n=1 Tax=Perkinsus olseni TaxID=32597 RepID=A0A7J6S3T2_PEROL|nr:hypothetical protein FOZ62_011065 [Perkinsus olseni]